MERNLVFPVQPPYQESDGFEADKPQPYLEAKLYIEKMEQENKKYQEEDCTDRTNEPLPTDEPEPLDHGVSLTVYPIKVPSMHFTCATVQWDMPHTPAEHLPSDEVSVEEPDRSNEAGLDWTVNSLSSNMPLLSQDAIDLISEEEGSAVTIENKVSSFQTCGTQDIHVNVFVIPSNEDDQAAFKDTLQTSEASRDSKPIRCESTDGSYINTEELETVESSEVPNEENKNPENITQNVLTEPEQALGDTCKEMEDMELYSDDENEKDFVNMNVMCQMDIKEDQSASWQQDKEDTKQIVEPGLLEDSGQTDQPSFAGPPEPAEQTFESVCEAKQDIKAIDCEVMKLKQEPEISSEWSQATGNSDLEQSVLVATLDSDDETLQLEQLQHAEAYQKMQGSVLAENQEEPTCEEQTESSVEKELPAHKKHAECSTRMEPSEESEHLNELEHSEPSKREDMLPDESSLKQSKYSNEQEHPSKQEDTLADEESLKESQQFECSKKREHADQSTKESSSETQPTEQSKQLKCSNNTEPSQLSEPDNTEQTQQSIQLDQPQQTEHTEYKQQIEDKEQLEHIGQEERSLAEHMCGAEKQLEGQMLESVALVVPYENGRVEAVDRDEARRLAERLYKLENVQPTDVVRHLDKDNAFSRAVGEEYLKFFDFTDQNLDEALRSFLKEVVLIGETQERERVLERFSSRYQQCNPDAFSSPGAVLTLTCAVMLLNTDLHGQNVGKSMSLSDFVSNLDGMNEGENFHKDLLKTLYTSIKNHPLEWAIEENELAKSMLLEQDSDPESSLRSKSNPFQDLAHDKKATVFQKGFLKRKAHADIDGKRTPWGKRSWKIFYAVLKGMVLYLQKDEYRKDWQNSEEVLSVHHALAERAEDYTKRPHVFRLQTADWRVFLFEAASTEQMNSWISRINLVSALYSSPPFPAAVGSRRKFCRPILPATQSALNLDKQLHSHAAMLKSFQEDLNALQQGVPESRKAKARELEEHRHREEYLQHEKWRYEVYVQILEVWQKFSKSSETPVGTDLAQFDQEMWKGTAAEDEDHDEMDGAMKRSHSSPSLELELAPPTVVKVRRNISERRTYRKIVIPRRNKEL